MQKFSKSVSVENRDDIGLIWVDNPPVNALSQHVREGLAAAFPAVSDDASLKAVVLICRGRTFIAGADIREFGKTRLPPHFSAIRIEMENLNKPLIAAIHGTALGGGLETTLACHYRFAHSAAKLGLPEVKLGILPGGGGTQRLPRLVGVKKALEMIISGEPISAGEALELGLVDAVAEKDLETEAIAFARGVVKQGGELRKVRDIDSHKKAVSDNPGFFDDFRKSIARKTRGFEAPEACIQCVEASVELPFDDGLKRETELFTQLVGGLQSEAQRYYFFAERTARRIPDVPSDTPQREIRSIGMIGAGTMGGGISMNFASLGIPVTIVEQSQDTLDRGLAVVRSNYERTAKRGGLTLEQVDENMSRYSSGTDLEALADCDLIVEAVFENMDIKKDVFGQLNTIAKEGAILASNTSGLDINEIAAATDRPEDVVGMHFFSPANIMKLVEVVRGEKTGRDVIATAMGISRTVGKVPVLVGVCHGFVGNRLLAQRRIQADKLVLEGALPWDVDRVLYDFGLPMGPFRMTDLAGLDIGWQKETSASSTLREYLCEHGRFGQKNGKGFYLYDPETRAATPDPEVEKLIAEFSRKVGAERREIADDEILKRCLYPMVNEGARILEDGVALRASDIDVIWVNGYGWPVYTGGPMFWADHTGLSRIVETYEAYQERFGEGWEVAPLLRRLADDGGQFSQG